MPPLTPLPIDAILPDLQRVLRDHSTVLLQGPPGSGKTTRVPPAVLPSDGREVLVLEPRRLAARLAAKRVAEENGDPLGETVGYQVRFEDVSSSRTRIRFVTEGVLNRKLLSDPALRRVAVVILDEFHERHLEGDLALALLRRLQSTTRPDLKLIIMSATLGTGNLQQQLAGCPVLRFEGQLYDLEISHRPHSTAPLEEQVVQAAENALASRRDGDVLVFLPGAAEINRCLRASQQLARRLNLLAVPLHGDLSPADQDLAVSPGPQRKLIFSTNVAESSVTIEGVRIVIDSGLARVAADSPWSGIPTLQVARISRASATQRAGRAGRTGPGYVIRLYPADEFYRRPEFDTPEIERKELSALVLECAAMNVGPVDQLPWIDPPPAIAVQTAASLLNQLGAVDEAGTLTATGREMSRYPLHPRLGRLVVEALRRHVGRDGVTVAALLSAGQRLPSEHHAVTPSDLIVLLESDWDPPVRRLQQQMARIVRPPDRDKGTEEDLLQCILSAFPDRVARRRKGTEEFLLASGGSALLATASTVRDSELIVAVEVEERREQRMPLIRLASGIQPEWLLDQFADRLRDEQRLEWNRKDERVEAVSSLVYQGLTIEESRSQPDPEPAAAFLADKALELGLERLIDIESWEAFRARLAFAAEHSAIPQITEAEIRQALRELGYGLRTWRDLHQACRDGGLEAAVLRQLPAEAASRLEQIAPPRIRLPSGRQARIFYTTGQTPYVASRLQDFFGLNETPRIANGRVPLLVHLLAPNQRPVQVTGDLRGFWERLYPQVRRELSRRYPRHAWPEDPRVPAD